MPKQASKRLVIDASVARAAGLKGAEAPESSYCREFLSEVLTVCHRLVMSPDLRTEWEKHESRFARKWRKTMKARKKLVPLARQYDSELRDRVAAADPNPGRRRAMLKDLHLIEAALNTDKIVVSLDEEAHDLFGKTADLVPELLRVAWHNPALEGETCTDWLRELAGK